MLTHRYLKIGLLRVCFEPQDRSLFPSDYGIVVLAVLKCIEIIVCADHAITRSTTAVSAGQDRRRHDSSQFRVPWIGGGGKRWEMPQPGLGYSNYQ